MILTITVTLLLATNVLLVITIGGLLKKNDQKKQFSIQECPCCREKVLKSDNFCMHCGRDLWK